METYNANPERLTTKPPIAPKPTNISKVGNSPSTRKTYPRKSTNSRADDDLYAEQTTPMMARGQSGADLGHHQAAAEVLGSHLTGENDQSYRQPSVMDYGEPPKHPSPTGKLAWIGFGLAVFALTCMCISFASPYWLQQWPLSFSTFENMGLWEVCFHNYMHHRDDLQEIYNGCFWVFDSSEKYSKLRDWLLPPWFLACQVMCVAVLLVEIAVVIVTALVFLHMCPMMNHEYHQIFSMFISGAMMFLCTMTSVIVAILFGVQIQDRNWMPRPDWNFLSWGFGFLIISGMMALASGFLLFTAAWRSYNKLLRLQDDYFKQAMDMSQMYPTSQSQASYGAGYSDKPSYTSQPSYDQGGYRDKPSYASQPSYDQEYRDKPVEKQDMRPSYGQSQSSYGEPEKAGYRGQQSYDGSQYGKPVDGQRGYSQGSYNGNRSREGGYDGNQSYDSTQGYDQGGYNQGGYDQGGYNQGGYGQGGYGQGQGYNQYGPRA